MWNMSKQTLNTDHTLQHRRAKFDYAKVPVYWNGGDAFTTRFLDALSVNFPTGERFFMDTVRAFEGSVSDPRLREQIALFVRQEAQHGAAHASYNERLAGQGIKVASILRSLTRQQKSTQRRYPLKKQLALTAAAEHVTAMLAEGLLGAAPMLDEQTDPTMRALFLWHAVEEVEHKAVAFDVYQSAAQGDYLTRASAMIMFTLYLHVRIAAIMKHMLEVDDLPSRRLLVARGLWRMYGPRGYLTRLLPSYLAWFRPGFHPWQSGMPAPVAAWIAEYERHHDPMLAMRAVFPEVQPG
ncbi:MAG: putative metal-dependent hydrolase [Myxococcaceae bacterium]|nr:putative metal-dependent hydrolase [Myxococcaceae bacterium]